MQAYTTTDKSDWPPGPWHDEPDKLSWTDDATGLPCLIVRNGLGGLCGYVGVGPGHPWHGRDAYDPGPCAVIVHGGGLSYSAPCQAGRPEAESVCHVPEPGQPDDAWWFGFDCTRSDDVAPLVMMQPQLAALGGARSYRDVDYVRRWVERLALQLAAADR